MKRADTRDVENRNSRIISIRHVSFAEIIKNFGRKNDLFYVVDSKEITYSLSVLRPCKTNEFSILYIDKGELVIRVDLKTHVLSAGTLFIKSPQSIFQVQGFSADCHFRMFAFTKELIGASGLHKKNLEAISFLLAQNDPRLHVNTTDGNTISSILNLLHKKSKLKVKPLYYNESVIHAFCLFVFEVTALYSVDENSTLTTITRKEHLAFEFLKLLPDHVKVHRSVNYYASLLNITPKYLSTCIKEVTGKTCGEIIDEMVILEAKVLLDDPALSIAQVADQLNFSDQFLFSKYFKSNAGSTPTAYRTSFQ